MLSQKNPSPHQGKTMQQMVAHRLVENGNGVNYNVTASLSPAEAARNYKIFTNLQKKNYMGNVITRVVLPHDDPKGKAEQARELETRRQLAQPWGNVFMHTGTDAQRMNNVSQQAYMKQRRLVPDNTYGGFYAFMHAMSAAFGQLHGGD